MRDRQKGFSLVELLSVVAIILIIAAIVIPNLLSKIAANEASAVNSLRLLNTACVLYATTYGGHPTTLAKLKPAARATSTAADLIDAVLASGTKSGYKLLFAATANSNGAATTYTIKANPVTRGIAGQRSFVTDQTAVIRENTTRGATATSTPIS
jgi:type IV pilus assembly protein PilA